MGSSVVVTKRVCVRTVYVTRFRTLSAKIKRMLPRVPSSIRCTNPELPENETGLPTAVILSPVLPVIMEHKNFGGFPSSDCSHCTVLGCDTVWR